MIAACRHADQSQAVTVSLAVGVGTSLEDRPRYTPSTTFETFPFPSGLTPDVPASDYAADPRAAVALDDYRRREFCDRIVVAVAVAAAWPRTESHYLNDAELEALYT